MQVARSSAGAWEPNSRLKACSGFGEHATARQQNISGALNTMAALSSDTAMSAMGSLADRQVFSDFQPSCRSAKGEHWGRANGHDWGGKRSLSRRSALLVQPHVASTKTSYARDLTGGNIVGHSVI